MSRYASKTTVAPEKSRNEIEATLRRYGAEGFVYGSFDGKAMIAFRAKGRNIKFMLPIPSIEDSEFKPKRARSGMRERNWEQGLRQRWRALALCIKAKLEAVEAGIVTFDEEFMAHIVLPGGQTVGEKFIPQLANALEGKQLPPLLTM